MKTCSTCKLPKPETREHFVLDNRRPDGLGCVCRWCFNAARRAECAERRRTKEPVLCSRCNERPVATATRRRSLCEVCLDLLRAPLDDTVARGYAARLEDGLRASGLNACVFGEVGLHNPRNNVLSARAVVRLRVTAKGRVVDISDMLSMWETASEESIGRYLAAYVRSVTKVLASRQLAANEVGAELRRQSTGDPGWADILACAFSAKRFYNGKKKAPEAAEGDFRLASGA